MSRLNRLAAVLIAALTAVAAAPAARAGADAAAQPEPAGNAAASASPAAAALEARAEAILARRDDAALSVRRLDGAVLVRGASGTVGPDTVMPIGSTSKWLAGALFMSLAEDGVLDLDAPIGRYLDAVPDDKAQITLRQLLNHTSGVPWINPREQAGFPTLAASAEASLRSRLQFEPGTRFNYSGTGAQIAGAVAEAVTGQSWDALFEARIAGPLGMTDTRFTEAGTQNRLIGGGARSTLADLERFLIEGMVVDPATGRSAILSAESLERLFEDTVAGAPPRRALFAPTRAMNRPDRLEAAYGLGVWCEAKDAAGRCTLLSSPGFFGSYLWLDRERGLAGVFLVEDRLDRVRDDWLDLQAAAFAAAAAPPD